jgi:hypothetical protein
MPGGEKRSADVIGAAMCGLTAGAWSMNGSFRNAFASLQAQSLALSSGGCLARTTNACSIAF